MLIRKAIGNTAVVLAAALLIIGCATPKNEPNIAEDQAAIMPQSRTNEPKTPPHLELKGSSAHIDINIPPPPVIKLELSGDLDSPIVYKNASGIDAVSLVIKGQGISIKEFDDETVEWTVPNSGTLVVKVPSGSHRFIIVDASTEEEKVSIDLLAGQRYEISTDATGELAIEHIERTVTEGTSSSGDRVWVDGYQRKDGTYVEGYWRTVTKTVTEDTSSSSGRVWVDGYYRKDGTYVRSYSRKK